MFSPLPGDRVRNPYYHLAMVRDPSMFFGRLNTLRRLYSAIEDQQCLSIVGPRRIGKSSVLGMLHSETLQRQFGFHLKSSLLAFIDTAIYPEKHTIDDFLHFACEQLIAQSQGRISPEMLPQPGTEHFRAFLDLVKAMGYHPVLLLDEFESITSIPQFNESFFAFLRAQANLGKISYITASRDSLDKVSHDGLLGSPFFNIFSTIRLGNLMKNEALELITSPSRAAGCPFTPDEVEWVIRVAGKHPFFLQRVCYFLFEEKSLSLDASVDLVRIEKQVYEEQLLAHFRYAWQHLDVPQQEQLAWEARRDTASQRKIPELSESGMFRKFVRVECSLDLSTLIADDIDEALKNLDNVRLLGESKLSYLNIIYQSIPDANASPVEKGAAVKKLMLAALEKMRPQGSQKKSDVKERYYSILIWSQNRWKVEEVAARLSISVRQYHRDRDAAVQSLLNVILEMETASKEP